MTTQHPLTILCPVKEGKLDLLNQRLTTIRQRLENNTETEFKKVTTLHYGRWVILNRDSFRDEPAIPVGNRLIFSTNFDGDEDYHLNELATNLTNYIDDIFECCEGYPEPGERTTQSRTSFLKKWTQKTAAFFNGAPGRTVGQIKQEEALRVHIRNFIKNNKWDKNTTAVEIHRAIQKEVDSKTEFTWSKQKAELPRIFNLPNLLVFIGYTLLLLILFFFTTILMILFIDFSKLSFIASFLLIFLSLFLGLIQLWILFIHFFHERRDKNGTLSLSQLDDKKVNELKKTEDLFPQNQFTQVAVMKPGIVRSFNFWIWMLRTKVLAGRVFIKGKLLNIPTIHFARWVRIDNSKHVLFFSNFDGNWQQYLGDFIDQSGWGLSAIFSNTVNFPKTHFMGVLGALPGMPIKFPGTNFVLTGGAYDEEHFLAWSRSTQVPTQVWYCPYPHLSIKNVNNNTAIRNELWKDLNEEKAKAFLKRF
jgi:hypothetical protein